MDNISTQDDRTRRFGEVVAATVARLTRFADAIDMIAQSSSQVYGLDVLGLIWESMKVFLIVAKDLGTAQAIYHSADI